MLCRRLRAYPEKALTYFWHIPVSFVIEIHFPERILMAQLIVYQMLLVRHMADQGVGTEGMPMPWRERL